VVTAIGERRESVLVAQSLGGFTAPIVCERVPVDLLVLVNAMIPARRSPGRVVDQYTSRASACRACCPDRMGLARRVRSARGVLPRRIARQRLGITPDEMPGGHLVALSQPKVLTDRLETYVADLDR
jgi:hypothetical protein